MSILLSAKLNHLNLPGSIPSHILYGNRNYNLTAADYQYVMENLGSEYSNDTEKLSVFRVEKDDTTGHVIYFCEMEKTVFDFREREYIKRYAIKELTSEESSYLYEKFKDFLNRFYTSNIDNFYNYVVDNVGGTPLVAANILEIRNELLRESDRYMLSDYPHASEEVKQAWITYRQELRDLTDQEAYPNDFVNIQIPVAPDAFAQFDVLKNYISIDNTLLNEIGPEFMQVGLDNMIKNFAGAALKVEVLKSLSKLRIPMFVEQGLTAERVVELRSGLDRALFDIGTYENTSEENPDAWNDAMGYLNSKVEAINEKIAEYDLGFTVEDLIDELVEETKKSIAAEQLIDEL